MAKTRWTESEKEQLKAHYHAISAERMSELLDRSPAAIKEMAWRMDLKKCQERLAEVGRENIKGRWDPPSIQT